MVPDAIAASNGRADLGQLRQELLFSALRGVEGSSSLAFAIFRELAIGIVEGRLPPGHEVSALVVVHPTGRGELTLPDAIACDLAWALACDAVDHIRAGLPPGGAPVSMKALEALTAATALW